MTIMHKTFVGSLSLSFLLHVHAQLPEAKPIPRDGSCPSDYVTEGKFCTPGAGAQMAIPKHGACPRDYAIQGNYCVANQNAKAAVLKYKAICPSGSNGQGNYCVKN